MPGFLVSGYQGFGVHGFMVSSGSGSLSGSGSIVSGFRVSWFQGFIGVGIAIGIGIGSDCFTTEHNRLTVSPPHNLTAFEVAGSARISIRQNPMFAGLC